MPDALQKSLTEGVRELITGWPDKDDKEKAPFNQFFLPFQYDVRSMNVARDCMKMVTSFSHVINWLSYTIQRIMLLISVKVSYSYVIT